MKEKTKVISTRISNEINEGILKYCKEHKMKRSKVLAELIDAFYPVLEQSLKYKNNKYER